MTIKRELKELRAGKKSPEDLEYLKSLSASDILKVDDKSLLEAWNNLQSTPKKRRNFTFVMKMYNNRINKHLLENYPTNRNSEDELVEIPSFPLYAFIKHDKDRIESSDDLTNPDKGIHYHYFVEYKNARSFASVANEFQIPVTMIEQVWDRSGILNYLTHEKAPDKHHYDVSEVKANFNLVEERNDEYDFMQFARDYSDMRNGKITYDDMIRKYQRYIVRHCSFYQQFKILGEIYEKSRHGK